MRSIPYPDSFFEPRYGYFSPWGRLTLETLQCVARMDDTPDYENLSIEDAHYLSLYVAEAYNYACKHNAVEYIPMLLDNFRTLRECTLLGTGVEFGHDEAYAWLASSNG